MQVPGLSGFSQSVSFQAGYDFSRAFDLSSNQVLAGGFAVSYNNYKLNGSLGEGANNTSLSLSGGVIYRLNRSYVIGSVVGDFGRGSIHTPFDSGSFGTYAYLVDIAPGHVFNLWGSPGFPRATVKPMRTGLLAVDLDVSARLGYARTNSNSFVDTTGFAWGINDIHTGIVGAKARLIGSFGTMNGIVAPYVLVGVDHLPGYSQTTDIPAQLGAGPDAFVFDGARTYGRVEAGVNWRTLSGLIASVSGNYSFSSQLEVAGAKASLTIPFFSPAAAPAPGPPSSASAHKTTEVDPDTSNPVQQAHTRAAAFAGLAPSWKNRL